MSASNLNVVALAPFQNVRQPRPVRWSWAHSRAIPVSATAGDWRTGPVNDLLPFGNVGALVAMEFGGAWYLRHQPDAIPQTQVDSATPLSLDWTSAHARQLAVGPDGPTSVFVLVSSGYFTAGVIRVLRFAPKLGAIDFVDDTALPAFTGTDEIVDLVVLSTPRVVVCMDKTGRVQWSPIPANPADVTGYSWTLASGLPGPMSSGSNVRSLAACAGGKVAASTLEGLSLGSWESGALVFQQRLALNDLRSAKIASCAGSPNVVYALVHPSGGKRLLVSNDGGNTWPISHAIVNGPNANPASNFVLALDVKPDEAMRLAYADKSGVSISADGGATWSQVVLDPPGYAGGTLAVRFEPGAPGRLWVGCGDGVAVIDLATLAFTREKSRVILGVACSQFALSASPSDPGLIVAGVEGQGAWSHFADGDSVHGSRFFCSRYLFRVSMTP